MSYTLNYKNMDYSLIFFKGVINMNIDTNKYYDYRRQVLGKYIDRDGADGSPCWDLY